MFACLSAVFLALGGLGFVHWYNHGEYLFYDHITWSLGVLMALIAYCLLTEVMEEEDEDPNPSVDLTGAVPVYE